MARLKTLTDGTNEAAAVDPVASDPAPETTAQGEAAASAEEPAPETVTGGGTGEADADPATAPAPAEVPADLAVPTDPALSADPGLPAHVAMNEVDALEAEVQRVTAALEAAHAEFLDQSDKLAAANAEIASLEADVGEKQAEIDRLTATVAQRDAQIAAMGSVPPPEPAEAGIFRVRAGDALTLPEDGAHAKWGDVLDSLDAGGLVQVALVGDAGIVQPWGPMVGGKALFAVRERGLLYAGAIDLLPELPEVTVRHAVLLDDKGDVLSTCRLGALLIGGGGNSALIPGNNLRFEFS